MSPALRYMLRSAGFAAALATAAIARAQQAAPAPVAAPPRPPAAVPPVGIAISEADRAELSGGVSDLAAAIDSLRMALGQKPELLRYLPDVQIYYNAVRYPLTYNEFYSPPDVALARRMLAEGEARAKALAGGAAPWTQKTGLVALGYVSRIDGSVQPYGILVPPTWVPAEKRPHRLDFFLHGRDEHLTELHFVDQRERSRGEFHPDDTFVLQPYGRYCNATRFAGEVDLFEALDDAKSRYPIDPNRVIVRGFSMGGASCWQYATHHADEFAGAAPGAGFTETANYTDAFGPGKTPPPPYQITLWHWYDSVDYAVNLAQLPTVAYSGEIDKQRQAAVNMANALEKEGLPLTQVIGPNTAHRYAAVSKPLINQFLDDCAAKGRDLMPLKIRFTTFTLRYNRMDWLTVDALRQHWQRARVEAARTPEGTVALTTANIAALTLRLPANLRQSVTIDRQTIKGGSGSFVRSAAGKWFAGEIGARTLRKRHGLQGPIDDAFLDSFIMVRPTGKPLNPAVGAWTRAEMQHAIGFWRAQFRGEARVIDDTAVTPDQIAHSHLILWGDPSSNAVLARIASRLPIRWDPHDGSLHANGKTYPGATSAPILIYPNPLNPARYVVLNSGITFREGNLSSNSLQTPKLPDWAVIDIATPPDAYQPGAVLAAGFFDEFWEFNH